MAISLHVFASFLHAFLPAFAAPACFSRAFRMLFLQRRQVPACLFRLLQRRHVFARIFAVLRALPAFCSAYMQEFANVCTLLRAICELYAAVTSYCMLFASFCSVSHVNMCPLHAFVNSCNFSNEGPEPGPEPGPD